MYRHDIICIIQWNRPSKTFLCVFVEKELFCKVGFYAISKLQKQEILSREYFLVGVETLFTVQGWILCIKSSNLLMYITLHTKKSSNHPTSTIPTYLSLKNAGLSLLKQTTQFVFLAFLWNILPI